LILIIKLNN